MLVKKSLSEQLYDHLREEILAQKIPFGAKLVNRELQQKYNVSSTPVRDAINRLYQDGLVEHISSTGAQVLGFDYDTAMELNEIISALNCSAIELCAEKGTMDAVVKGLQNYVDLQEKWISDKRYFNYDRLYHMVFFSQCQNSRFERLYTQYHALWELLTQFYHKDKDARASRGASIEQHRRILRACSEGDVPLAARYMRQHFAEAIEVLRAAL